MYQKLPYTGMSTELDVRHGLAPFPIWIAWLSQMTGIATVAVAQLAFTYAPWMQRLFDTRAVPWPEMLLIVAVGAAMLVVLEIEKAIVRRWQLFPELGTPSPPGRRCAK